MGSIGLSHDVAVNNRDESFVNACANHIVTIGPTTPSTPASGGRVIDPVRQLDSACRTRSVALAGERVRGDSNGIGWGFYNFGGVICIPHGPRRRL